MTNTKVKSTENFTITGDWTKQSELLKQKYSELSDADLKLEKGKGEEMLARIQSRLRKNRDEVIEIVKGLEAQTPVAHLTAL
jgi:hypothetical protein